MAFQLINHDDLRIGLYIKIDASWFNHPFPSNTFKIKTPKELDTLQALKNINIFFDLERSDHEIPEREIASQPVDDVEPQEPSHPIDPEPTGEEPPLALEPKSIPSTPLVTFERHCEGVRKADRVYQEAFQKSKTIIQNFSNGNPEGVEDVKDLISLLNGIVVNPEATTALITVMGAKEMSEVMFMHALNVCILSLMVGQEFGLPGEELTALALGALFHDIGELNVPGRILLKRPNLSQSDRHVYRQHPYFGKEMVKKISGMTHTSLDIIYQHHERLDGSGYPMGLKGKDAISRLAQIVMVMDWYDDLCHNADPAKCFTPSEALSHLFVKQKSVFCTDVIVTLILVLGVYPPGSLVRLSTNSLGMVININKHARTQPLVLLYTEDHDQDHAEVLDLEEDEELSITQTLRPQDVPQEIREFLHPRKMLKHMASTHDWDDAPFCKV